MPIEKIDFRYCISEKSIGDFFYFLEVGPFPLFDTNVHPSVLSDGNFHASFIRIKNQDQRSVAARKGIGLEAARSDHSVNFSRVVERRRVWRYPFPKPPSIRQSGQFLEFGQQWIGAKIGLKGGGLRICRNVFHD